MTLLLQRFDDGSIERSVAWIHASMNTAADELARGLSAPPVPDPAIGIVCERFAGAVIPQMIVVGALLARSLPE